MSDWRTILKASPSTQYPQNTQNRGSEVNFEDSEDFEERRTEGQPRIRLGVWITWPAADGSTRGPARVDFLYADAEGTLWAFVTMTDESWAAVNAKFVTIIEEGGSATCPTL